jgi:hypothetical protein
MRETILKWVLMKENTCRGEYAQLERLRNEANDRAKFHDIDRER